MRKGYYGDFGGQFVPELLMPPLLELEEAMRTIMRSEEFQKELNALLTDYVGRPSPLYRCPNLSQTLGFDLWLKREDLNHTGAHKINNTMLPRLAAEGPVDTTRFILVAAPIAILAFGGMLAYAVCGACMARLLPSPLAMRRFYRGVAAILWLCAGCFAIWPQ